ncbi:MAG: hypothetical protein ACREBE_09920 [bacterium]
MDELTGNEDGWVVARISALERANRRLWIGLAGLAMTLVSVCIAAGLLATGLELPGSMTAPQDASGRHSLVADDVTVRGTLRVVDEAGRNLVFIGREGATSNAASSSQAVIGLYAGGGSDAEQQTIRIATSPAGSAFSLGTPDGEGSVSMIASESAVSVDLRKGDSTRTLSARAESPPSHPPQPVASEGPRPEARAETRTVPVGPTSGAGAVVDLSDPAPQPIGDGFSVVGLSLSDESGVLRVRGRLVNSSDVEQLRAEFSLQVAGRELPFSVAVIAAGGSTPFSLELPPTKSDALRAARLRWVRSAVN